MKKYFEEFNLYKLILLLVVALIVVRLVHPPTAEWILTPIVELTRAAIQAMRDLGGT